MNVFMKLENISFSYNKNNIVLNNISLNLHPKKILFLLGHNGAGKTTLLRIMANLLKAKNGELRKDKDISLFYLPTANGLFPELTVKDNIDIIISILDVKINQILLNKYIEEYELNKYLNTKLANLSSGYIKRVGLLISMLLNKDILLLDEPFANIDPISKKILMDTIITYKKNNKSIVIATHELDMISNEVDEALILKNGIINHIETNIEKIDIKEIYYEKS